MRGWLAISTLLLAALALPARADSAVERWSHGDWWEVQLEHMVLHARTPRTGWTPSFRLRFTVTRTEKEVRVEVTTIPENRFQERLVLHYTPQGELITAQIVDPKRVEPLGPAGGFGVFGMLGREAFVLSKAPPATRLSRGPVRVALDVRGETVQTWGPGDAWWTQYETSEGLPQRATLVDASWRHPAVGEQNLRRE
jgi:hypothetical protein